MRRGIALCVIGLLLAGCTTGNTAVQSEPAVPTTEPSTEASVGAGIPADEPSLDHLDREGRSPDESVVALIEAMNRADWQVGYSLYATPEVDFPTAQREWTQAEEVYDEFRVLEVRVSAVDEAWVRVTYSAKTTPLSSATYPVVVEEPGEWWPVHKVDGLWKTQWMPRQ